MTIKQKIEEAALKYKRESGFSQDEDSFQDGADFAIKAVIKILEREKRTYLAIGHDCTANLTEEIINLLKSEA